MTSSVTGQDELNLALTRAGKMDVQDLLSNEMCRLTSRLFKRALITLEQLCAARIMEHVSGCLFVARPFQGFKCFIAAFPPHKKDATGKNVCPLRIFILAPELKLLMLPGENVKKLTTVLCLVYFTRFI